MDLQETEHEKASPNTSASNEDDTNSEKKNEYNFTNAQINNLVINENPSVSSANPTPFSRLRLPISHMTKTKTYHDVLEIVKSEKTCILHCCGVAGSGKSQIIRRLAKLFPFPPNSGENVEAIKWHIQCKDSGHDVKEELCKLTDELFYKAHISTKEEHQFIRDELNANSCDKLVGTLLSCDFPFVIIVEDPDVTKKNCIELLENFLRKLTVHSSTEYKQAMHFYITSQTSSSILKKDETHQINIFKKISICGFDESEALRFLESDDDSAKVIFQRFSGLPLGLQAAKAFCDETGIDYTEYLELLQDADSDCNDGSSIIENITVSDRHVFQAIVLPFLPSDESNSTSCLHWDILCCLSYFNYDRIPRFVVEHCCNLLRKHPVRKANIVNKADVGRLVTKLLDHNMCSETEQKEITFHEVVSNAFRLNRHSVLSQQFSSLPKSIEIMAGLVSKDMRKKEHSNQMYKLRRHVQTLLGHIENDSQIFRCKDSTLLKALASHMYETAGAIMLNESPALFLKTCEKYFDEALRLIWDSYQQLQYNGQELDPGLARDIVKKSQEKGKSLPKGFTLDYASKLKFHLSNEEIKFLKSKSSSPECLKKVEEHVKSKQSNRSLFEEMQNCNLLLSDEKYSEIFYAERVASILHSYSRYVLYVDKNEVQQHEKKCMWMTWLSNCIAAECKKTFGVSLLTEHISQIGGLIPIVLKLKKDSIDDNKKVLKFCKDILLTDDKSSVMYENGMLKVFGPSSTSNFITLLRSIVRVNGRLLVSGKYELDIIEADRNCSDLFKLSVEHWREIASCTLCIIYCAKYYAARKNSQKSFECFVKFFDINSDKTSKIRFNVLCWAVYNYVRAVDCFSATDLYHNATEHIEKIFNSKEAMSKDLKKRIESLYQKLKPL